MKKFILFALTLMLSTGVVMADKKCCKDKKNCKKEACAKKEETKACASKKACCKNKAEASATDAPAPALHACCQKAVAAGKMPCCAKKATAAVETENIEINEDGTVAE